MLHYMAATLTWGLLLAIGVTAEGHKVCSPTGCLEGSSSSKILSTDKDSLTDLTVGAYIVPYQPMVHLNQSVTHINSGVVVHPPAVPVLFSSATYFGKASAADITGSTAAWSSAYIPEGWYGVVSPGNALWVSVVDKAKLGIASIGPFGSDGCDPSCARGSCNKGKCACLPGWTGSSCDNCAPGFFGPNCSPCSANCTNCDSGISGSGYCLGATKSPKECNCVHGTCENGGCTCQGGYMSLGTSTTLCSECIDGFYADTDGVCSACPSGCSSCAVDKGTGLLSCTACDPSLRLTPTVPGTCLPISSCSSGRYWDTSSSSCKACSALCGDCYGPGVSDCLTCGANKGRLGTMCVTYTGDGKCASADGTLVINTQKARCDACPVGCSSCVIPNLFTATGVTTLFEPVCDACTDGYLFQNGACVTRCADGTYASEKGTCEPCESSCKMCVGTSTHCTSCASGLASNGTCVPSCPSSTVQANNTCSPCHPDCATCKDSSATSCLTCPSARPVLSDGRCIPVCPKGTFFNATGRNCLPCAAGCDTCLDGSTCASCKSEQILNDGVCAGPSCSGPYVSALGVCLSSLIDTKPPAKDLSALAALVFIPILVLGIFGFLFIRRERRKTREATRDFATKIDDRNVGRKLKSLSATVLDRAFGRDRDRERVPDVERELDTPRRSLRDLMLSKRSNSSNDDSVPGIIPMRRVSIASSSGRAVPSGRTIMRAASAGSVSATGPRVTFSDGGEAPLLTPYVASPRGAGAVETLAVDTDSVDNLVNHLALPPYSPHSPDSHSAYTPASGTTFNEPYLAKGARPLPRVPSPTGALQLIGLHTPESQAFPLPLHMPSVPAPATTAHHVHPQHPVAAALRRAGSHHRHASGGSEGSCGSGASAASARTAPEELRQVWPAYRAKMEQPRVERRKEGGWV